MKCSFSVIPFLNDCILFEVTAGGESEKK